MLEREKGRMREKEKKKNGKNVNSRALFADFLKYV